MAFCDGLSHCKLALAFAVLMDLLGGTALLVGVFAPLEIQGRDFGDLLVYTGMKHRMSCRLVEGKEDQVQIKGSHYAKDQ